MEDKLHKILDAPIGRRTFLKAVGAGTAVALFGSRAAMEEAFASMPTIGIVSLGTCNGCQVSLAEFGMDLKYISSTDPTFAAMIPTVDIKFAPLLVDVLDDSFLNDVTSLDMCFVEGIAGDTVEATELLQHVRAISKKVVAVGMCSAFGGIPGLNTRKGLLNVYPINKVIRVDQVIRGCPPTAEHIWYVASGGVIGEKTATGKICDSCIYLPYSHEGPFAKAPGQFGCKKMIGCQGPMSMYQCKAQRSTDGKSICTFTDDLCTGCYRDAFPATPFYRKYMMDGMM